MGDGFVHNPVMTADRLIDSSATREDDAIEASIRPKRLDEYLGQKPVREQLEVAQSLLTGLGYAGEHFRLLEARDARDLAALDTALRAPAALPLMPPSTRSGAGPCCTQASTQIFIEVRPIFTTSP